MFDIKVDGHATLESAHAGIKQKLVLDTKKQTLSVGLGGDFGLGVGLGGGGEINLNYKYLTPTFWYDYIFE